MNDIYTWSDDMYPIVKKYFDERYASRVNFISDVAGVVKQDSLSYDIEGLGGYGELPVYSADELAHSDGTKGFIATVTPVEHALAFPVEYKNVKNDIVAEAKKVGTRLADSAYMTVLREFYRAFGGAYTNKGADGVIWASGKHPVNTEEVSGTFSNFMTSALSVSAILEAQKKANHLALRKKVIIYTVLFIPAVLLNAGSFVTSHIFPVSWIIALISGIVWLVYSYGFYAGLRDGIENKYL
jgi:hypothetical protein